MNLELWQTIEMDSCWILAIKNFPHWRIFGRIFDLLDLVQYDKYKFHYLLNRLVGRDFKSAKIQQ